MKRILAILIVVLSACSDASSSEYATLFAEVQRLAQQGNPEAQYHVGMMYNNGLGVDKNPQKAFEWFGISANLGDPLGSYKLGCYFGGQFNVVPIDLNKSLQYKLVAAKAGYSLAQYDVGIAYFERKNFSEAVHWWELAAKQGYLMALYNLSVVYKEGKIVPKDNVRTYAYFKLAKLLSEKRINEKAQGTLDDVKINMLPAELEKAEQMVSLWKAEPTPLTIKAFAGIEETKRLVGNR